MQDYLFSEIRYTYCRNKERKDYRNVRWVRNLKRVVESIGNSPYYPKRPRVLV